MIFLTLNLESIQFDSTIFVWRELKLNMGFIGHWFQVHWFKK